MRIGLAGVGRIGAFHAETLREVPGVGAVIVADANPDRAREVARRLGVQAAGSPGALVGSGIDALVVATATDAHPEFIAAGAAAGIPVFCEKPVASDVRSTLDVIQRAGDGAIVQDALEAFYIAEACEVSRGRHEPVQVAEVRG